LELGRECQDELARARIIADVFAINPVAFIEACCFIKIPEFQNSIKPFFLFQYQKDILWKLVEAERSGQDVELLIDKLRGMGMTWLLCAYLYWRWLFTPNWSCLILSRTETEVDDGTDSPDNSIFGKIRFMMQRAPAWLTPDTFTAKAKKGTSTDSSLRIMNPTMGTSINGSSTNSNAGRSRRYSLIFIDECFYIERFTSVWRALQEVARVKIFVSSVKQGRTAEQFKEKCEREGNYITLSWKDHPWKDEEWFNAKMALAEFDPEVVREFEVDYSVTLKDQYYPEIRQSKIEPLAYYPKRPLYCFLDFGKQDLTVIGWCQFDGNWIDVLDVFCGRQKPVDYYVPFLNPDGFSPELSYYNETQQETLRRVRAWKKPIGYFGEQAHFNKVMPLNISIAQVLFRSGIRLMCNTNAVRHDPRRHATSLLLPKTRFNEDSSGAMELYDALAQSRYAVSRAATSEETGKKPVHDDDIADFRAAFENMCVNVPRILKSQREDIGDNFRGGGFASSLITRLRV
jgi:hypothetical protein